MYKRQLLKPAALPTATFVAQAVTIPARSQRLATLTVPRLSREQAEGVLTGSNSFMQVTDVHPPLRSIVQMTDKRCQVPLLNTLNYDVTVPADTYYGSFAGSDQDDWADQVLKSANSVCALRDRPAEGAAGLSFKQKMRAVMSAFDLGSDYLVQQPSLKNKLIMVLVRHFDAFTLDGTPGKSELVTHEIHTTDGPPVRARVRPLNPELEKSLQEQLDNWLKQDLSLIHI